MIMCCQNEKNDCLVSQKNISGSRAEWDHIFKKVRANSYLCLLDKVMLVLIVCRCYVDVAK